jgi:hypothetical protein
MVNWLRSLTIFGAMVATPFVMDRLVSHRRQWSVDWELGKSASNATFQVTAAALVVLAVFLLIVLFDKMQRIATYLTLAERDLNSLLSSGMEHGGRKAKAIERSEWNRMSHTPTTQIFNEGYRTVAHDLVTENEKDLQGKGSAMGKASITAFLLRELYEGNVEAAQGKIVADAMNGDKVPYVAPGIRELVGFKDFKADSGFPRGSGVDWTLLRMTAALWGFPRHILMVKTDSSGQRSPLMNRDVLTELTRQKL